MLSFTRQELEKVLKNEIKDEKVGDIKYPEEAIEVLADVLNDVLEVSLLLVNEDYLAEVDEDSDEFDESEAYQWVDAWFGYRPYDSEQAFLVLNTAWYNIGTIWTKKIDAVETLGVEYDEEKDYYKWDPGWIAWWVANVLMDEFDESEDIQIDIKEKKLRKLEKEVN